MGELEWLVIKNLEIVGLSEIWYNRKNNNSRIQLSLDITFKERTNRLEVVLLYMLNGA